MNSQSAYTFIEALVVLAILAILAGIAVPRLQHWTDASRDEMLRGKLMRAIELARTEAYARSIPVALCKSKNKKSCGGGWEEGQIVFINQEEDGVVHDPSDRLSSMDVKSNHGQLYWRSFPFYRDYLLFFPDGFANSDNGTFWHCHDKLVQWAIKLNKTGQTHVVYPDESGVVKDGRGRDLKCL